jgi:hypothetical protein
MTQQARTKLQDTRAALERGSQRTGIPISADRFDELATYVANNTDPATGELPPGPNTMNDLLKILGITMDQLQKISMAGMKP